MYSKLKRAIIMPIILEVCDASTYCNWENI